MKENYIRLIEFFLKNPMCLNILYREVRDGSYHFLCVSSHSGHGIQESTKKNGKTVASLSQEHKFCYIYKFFLKDKEKSFLLMNLTEHCEF